MYKYVKKACIINFVLEIEKDFESISDKKGSFSFYIVTVIKKIFNCSTTDICNA